MLRFAATLCSLLVASLLAICLHSNAYSREGAGMDAGRPPYTDGDWALFPEWCVDTQDKAGGPTSWSNPNGRNSSPRSDYWTSIFGKDFWSMHHFCRGLYWERRIYSGAQSPTQRLIAAKTAADEFRYLIRHCAESMPLMPEVYYRIGDMELRMKSISENYNRAGDMEFRLKKLAEAQEAFAAARRIKPDYWPAYTRWVDELISLRLFDTANELVEEGLRHAPGQPQLLERKQRVEQGRKGRTTKSRS